MAAGTYPVHPLYLNAADGALERAPVKDAASVSYKSVCHGTDPADHVQFDITFDRDTELTGYMKLLIFMSTTRVTISMYLWVAQARPKWHVRADGLLCPVRRRTSRVRLAARLAPRA